jgi:calcium-translocating P-type ATPase
MAEWHALEKEELLRRLEATPEGLSEQEAKARLERFGPNELEDEPPIKPLAVLLHQFTSPLIYILIIAAVVTLAIGEYIDSIVIAAVLILNAVIGFVQEHRAESAARALRQMVSPKARVQRDGRVKEIDSVNLVPGDLVLLESGDRIPADLRMLESINFNVDEAALTGESIPVEKGTRRLSAETTLADRRNMAYAGAAVTSGRARGLVVATGAKTELGKIAETVRQEKETVTPLQQRMNRFAKIVGVAVAVAAVASFIIGLALGESLADMFMVAVALAVAAIPEGLPVVFTITLAVGVSRMARRKAIVRKLPAVETLGSATVIGTDKTGTLTENRMTVESLWAGGKLHELTRDTAPQSDKSLELLALSGVLANEASVVRSGEELELQGDPTETALYASADRLGLDPMALRDKHKEILAIPFESENRYAASYREVDGETTLFVKGAPERIVEMSTQVMTADGIKPIDPELLREAAQEMAAAGMRVLGFAYRPQAPAPEDHDHPGTPSDLVFIGFQGMKDPPREGVLEAIQGCKRAGIRVVMITGDHAVTAKAIGKELDIIAEGETVLTGRDLDSMSEEALQERSSEISIYARVDPHHKLAVVRAMKARNEVVAVTGDGVNDAPALKAADIGIAMGQEGTDVAREASDMVLADDNFSSIFAAVEEGRITFDNLRKATFFLISTGAAAILMILTAQVLRWPLPMLPAQLLWLNLVTNGLQDVALAFEPGEKDVTLRRPRSPSEGVVSALLWERTLITGIVMAAGTLYMFNYALVTTGNLLTAQTTALTTMVLYQAFHVGNSRSIDKSLFQISPFSNKFLLGAQLGALGIHILALNWSPLQFVLRVEPLPGQTWLHMLAVSLTIVVAMEIHKVLRKPRHG